jgi:hypothetical protein
MDSNALDPVALKAAVDALFELDSDCSLTTIATEAIRAYLAGVKPPAVAVGEDALELAKEARERSASKYASPDNDSWLLLKCAEALERLARAGQSVPSGLDPTESMIEEGAKAIVGFYSEELWISDSEKDRNAVRTARMEAARCWRAMRSAAPPPQASGQTFADGVAEKVRILATEALASGDTRQPWSDTAIKIEALIGLLPTPPSVSAQHKEAGE